MSAFSRLWPRSLYAQYFLSIFVSTTLTTLWTCYALSQGAGFGRLRSVGYAWLVRRVGPGLGLDERTFHTLGSGFLSRQYLLDTVPDFSHFTLLALGCNLTIALLIGIAGLPVVFLLKRAIFDRRDSTETQAHLSGAFLLAVLCVFAFPAWFQQLTFHPSLSSSIEMGVRFRHSALFALAGYLLFLRLLPLSSAPRWIVRSGALVSGVIFAATLAGTGWGAFTSNFLPPDNAILSQEKPPNILLISIDTLRADHLSCYGYERNTSPFIDSIASQGVRFARAMAPTPWTLPSHLSMLTGLDPADHGIRRRDARLGQDAILLPEVLRDAGYTTAGFASGPFLQSMFGYFQGFDYYDDYLRSRKAPDLIESVTNWFHAWDENGRTRPFFVFLHVWDVHWSYDSPEPYYSMYDPGYEGPVRGDLPYEEILKFIHEHMPEKDLHQVIALYDGGIRYTDSQLQKFMAFLDGQSALDETIVVVTADHGEEFFEHGSFRHWVTLYDEVLRVPLIIRYPERIPAGRVVENQVRLKDIAPTLLSLAGITPPENFACSPFAEEYNGRDFSPLIFGAQTPAEVDRLSVAESEKGFFSLTTGRYKLIINPDHFDELYDLVEDPGERNNLRHQRPELAGELYRLFDAWAQDHAQPSPFERRVQTEPARSKCCGGWATSADPAFNRSKRQARVEAARWIAGAISCIVVAGL